MLHCIQYCLPRHISTVEVEMFMNPVCYAYSKLLLLKFVATYFKTSSRHWFFGEEWQQILFTNQYAMIHVHMHISYLFVFDMDLFTNVSNEYTSIYYFVVEAHIVYKEAPCSNIYLCLSHIHSQCLQHKPPPPAAAAEAAHLKSQL